METDTDVERGAPGPKRQCTAPPLASGMPATHCLEAAQALTVARASADTAGPGAQGASKQQQLLCLDRAGVEKLKMDGVQCWAAAALQSDGLDDNYIVRVVAILEAQQVTGRALLGMTIQKLMAVGIVLGPAELLAERIQQLNAGTQATQVGNKLMDAPRQGLQYVQPQELPWETKKVDAPDMMALEAGRFVDAGGFADLLITRPDRPMYIYMRKHLVDVCNACIEELKGTEHLLVSLVGCPGTGKTWCGWFVAHQLHYAGLRTLHLSFRNMLVSAVINFHQKRTFEMDWQHYSYSILKNLKKETECDVCILDVSDVVGADSDRLFNGMRGLVDLHGLKVMAIFSGHGEHRIVGPGGNSDFLAKVRRVVFWSWTKDDVEHLQMQLKAMGVEMPEEAGYEVCGGSVRLLLNPKQDKLQIQDNVPTLSEHQLKSLVTGGNVPSTDQNEKQFSNLLAFYPDEAAECPLVAGFGHTRTLPRSRYVILSLRRMLHCKDEDVVGMYRALLPMNPGAAGTAFELLVHRFWDRAILEHRKVALNLQCLGMEDERLEVDCAGMAAHKLEDYQEAKGSAAEPPIGYFVPNDPRYPVIDSVLRFKFGLRIRTLAIQVSTAQKHQHGPLENHLVGGNTDATRQLALWDNPTGGKRCTWNPLTSEHWALVYVQCPEFEKQLRGLGMAP